jgi:hypothetical protein
MFEDANHVGGADGFAAMVADLKARRFDTVLFTNNFTYRDEPLLGVADRMGFRVVFAPHAELNGAWWQGAAPATLDDARRVVYPLVDHVKRHPSLVGYNVLDDAPNGLAAKAALAVQAFRERDPDRPATPVVVGGHDAVLRQARPDVVLTYVYPALVARPPCDFVSRAGGGAGDDVIRHIRQVTALMDTPAPIWMILQTHGGTKRHDPADRQGIALREPTVEEVRLQFWLALGEGVRGVYWFIYGTQQFWTGLRDNPALYAEVTDLARRTGAVSDLLPTLRKGEDNVSVAADASLPAQFAPYSSTLVGRDGRVFVAAVNRSCGPQSLRIGPREGSALRASLRDLESNERYALGEALRFRGGDGRLFELVGA